MNTLKGVAILANFTWTDRQQMPHHGISSSVLQPDELKTKQEALAHKTAETNQDNMPTTMLASRGKKGLASLIAR